MNKSSTSEPEQSVHHPFVGLTVRTRESPCALAEVWRVTAVETKEVRNFVSSALRQETYVYFDRYTGFRYISVVYEKYLLSAWLVLTEGAKVLPWNWHPPKAKAVPAKHVNTTALHKALASVLRKELKAGSKDLGLVVQDLMSVLHKHGALPRNPPPEPSREP